MEQIIENLEKQLAELKKAYGQEQKKAYENRMHKQFKKGDWVTDGNHIGVVGWVENKALDCPGWKGYMGVDLKNGSLGFIAFTKRDEWKLLEGSLLAYYTRKTKIEIELTGADINRLKYQLGGRNVNPSKIKSKFLDLLDSKIKISETTEE